MEPRARRILTTHCGSLPRPPKLLDLMKAKLAAEQYNEAVYYAEVRAAVADSVAHQVDCGIDIVTDGEQSKPGFFSYINERLTGFEPDPDPGVKFADERAAFPEYYDQYFSHAMLGGSIAPIVPMICTGPIGYRGREAVTRDIDNLQSALREQGASAAFMPAVAPNGIGRNAFYSTDEEYLYAVADALRVEYLAIVDAGLVLQVDDPFLTDTYGDSTLSEGEQHKAAQLNVEVLNHALRGIEPERIRFHTCYGINEGPRIHDAPLRRVAGAMLEVNAGAYSFEAANPRHEHEYHVWESIELPAGKTLIPGVVAHASNIVEHPELIAERLCRYAKLVGREHVIAGTDCGFSSQATYRTEVHPTVVWAKLRAMAEGARLATTALWS